MVTAEQALRLGRLQERVYRCIEDELRRDGHHKSYEGAMDITMSLPDLFSRGEGPTFSIELHCYVMASMNGRHKSWSGSTLSDAIACAEQGIDDLCKPYEFARFKRDMDALCDDECERSGGVSYGPNRSESANEEGIPF